MRLLKSFGQPKKHKMFLRRVSGESMLPAYRENQILLLVRRTHPPQTGDVVMVLHEGLEKLKRIERAENGYIFVVGDNKRRSNDSRHFGWLDASQIIGTVIWPRRKPNKG